MWSVIATSLVAFSVLSAADTMSSGSMKNSNTNSKTQNNQNVCGGIQGGYDFSIDAAALLWKAQQGGTEFAVTDSPARHVQRLASDYDWGFRVGLAYTMTHDRWNVHATWDHLRAGATQSTEPGWEYYGQLGQDDYATVTGSAGTSFQSYEQGVSSHWHLSYDTVDLDLKKDFLVGKWLCLAPHAGLRSAWINQNQHFTFGKGTGNEAEMKAKNDFWGLGIRAGVESQWGFGRGWSIFGNAAIAMLYGNFKVKSEEIVGTYVDNGGPSANLSGWSGTNNYHAGRANGDWTLGLRWNHMFSNDRYGLTLQAGYEQHIYWNMFNTTIPNATSQNGDLSLDGWTFAAKFDF